MRLISFNSVHEYLTFRLRSNLFQLNISKMCTNTICDNQNTYSQKYLWLVTNFFQFLQAAVCEPIRAQTEKTFFLLSFPLFSSYFIFVGAVQYFFRLQLPQSGKPRGPTFALLLFPRLLLGKAPPLFRIPIWPDKDWLSQTPKVHDLDCIGNITTLKNRKITKILS